MTQKKYVVDMRKEICAYVNLEELDNGLLSLYGIFEEHTEEVVAKIPKEAMKHIKESIKALSYVMDRIHAQYSDKVFDALLSGDRY